MSGTLFPRCLTRAPNRPATSRAPARKTAKEKKVSALQGGEEYQCVDGGDQTSGRHGRRPRTSTIRIRLRRNDRASVAAVTSRWYLSIFIAPLARFDHAPFRDRRAASHRRDPPMSKSAARERLRTAAVESRCCRSVAPGRCRSHRNEKRGPEEIKRTRLYPSLRTYATVTP